MSADKNAVKTTRVGWGNATVSTMSAPGKSISMSGRYEVRRATEPLDFALAMLGSIVIGHENGQDGIGLSSDEARKLAAILVQAADEYDALNAQGRS